MIFTVLKAPKTTYNLLKRSWLMPGGISMSLIIYLIGFAFVIGGIAWALIVAKVSTVYVMIAVVILVGVGILTGVTRTRSRD
jgi:amino acid transporter